MRLFIKAGTGLSRPQRQSGALTTDVLAVIRLTAVQPRKRGRGIETPEQAAERAKFDLALVAVLSDAGLRRSEAAALTWGDVQRWDDGSGRITVIRSKTDVEAQGAVATIAPAAMQSMDPIGKGNGRCRWFTVKRGERSALGVQWDLAAHQVIPSVGRQLHPHNDASDLKDCFAILCKQ